MWGLGDKDPNQEKLSTDRKCKAFSAGLEGCRKANPMDTAIHCKNLELRLVTCIAEVTCKEEAAEHKKCYTSLYKTGVYKGVGHCVPFEEAMCKCLKKKGSYPV